jgi:hypothetical protein
VKFEEGLREEIYDPHCPKFVGAQSPLTFNYAAMNSFHLRTI